MRIKTSTETVTKSSRHKWSSSAQNIILSLGLSLSLIGGLALPLLASAAEEDSEALGDFIIGSDKAQSNDIDSLDPLALETINLPQIADPEGTLNLEYKAAIGGFSIGTIEIAIWDAMAKIKEKPLHSLIADRYGDGTTPEKMFCYVGGGWYSPDETDESLKDEMRAYLDQGYTQVKAKVGGLPIDEDVLRIETILSVLDGGHQLAVDANCGLSPELALKYAERMKQFDLRWFEEPVYPIDFDATAAFVDAYGNPVATGENLFTTEDLRNLLRYGGFRPEIDILNIDVP